VTEQSPGEPAQDGRITTAQPVIPHASSESAGKEGEPLVPGCLHQVAAMMGQSQVAKVMQAATAQRDDMLYIRERCCYERRRTQPRSVASSFGPRHDTT
jgi:hypothetical protein